MSTSKPSSVPPKNQYHHYIPRFVLRRFQAEGTQVQYKNAKERKTANSRAQRKGIDLENILVYDLPSETLEIRPIATTYGVQNLYRDIKDADIDSLEKKLSVVESEAAGVVNLLHQSNGPRTILLKRTQLLPLYLGSG
ncbi:hypothetical protein Hypma_000305 [Hypsizygus marmoreus]|uniref:DUF4238 domain-containing protein n=1 Tax=Hypsizygus marmoreus TaxID=39966 RepID=A0A369JBG7_HYPMA|nr:hypothetical protein Hypma_000305 [Hypsizygus marmoreus]